VRTQYCAQSPDCQTLLNFRYYTAMPSTSLLSSAATFVNLPATGNIKTHFEEARNTLAKDEVQAHIGMFEPSTNDGYYQLGLGVASHIREVLMKRRGLIEDTDTSMKKVAENAEDFANAKKEEESSMDKAVIKLSQEEGHSSERQQENTSD
jgi:hypothetical protein